MASGQHIIASSSPPPETPAGAPPGTTNTYVLFISTLWNIITALGPWNRNRPTVSVEMFRSGCVAWIYDSDTAYLVLQCFNIRCYTSCPGWSLRCIWLVFSNFLWMLERGHGRLSPHVRYLIPTDTEGKASANALLQSPSNAAREVHLPVVAVLNLLGVFLSSLVGCYENGLFGGPELNLYREAAENDWFNHQPLPFGCAE